MRKSESCPLAESLGKFRFYMQRFEIPPPQPASQSLTHTGSGVLHTSILVDGWLRDSRRDAFRHVSFRQARRPGARRLDRKGRVRALLADNHMRLVLFEQALGGLRRRQRAACQVLEFDLELVAIDAGLIELLNRQFNSLLVLGAKIRHPGPTSGKSPPILISLSCAWAGFAAANTPTITTIPRRKKAERFFMGALR